MSPYLILSLRDKGIENRLVSRIAKRHTGKARRASLQIPPAVAIDANVSFAVAVIIGGREFVRINTKLNARKAGG